MLRAAHRDRMGNVIAQNRKSSLLGWQHVPALVPGKDEDGGQEGDGLSTTQDAHGPNAHLAETVWRLLECGEEGTFRLVVSFI